MIPPNFDYAAPTSVEEAVSLLSSNPDSKLLAGGHSLIPLMRFRLAAPALLIDLKRLSNLAYINEEGGWLKIGAMTREAELDLRGRTLRDAVDDHQRALIRQELTRADGNWSAAARTLGMHRSNLHHLAKRLGLL